MSEHEPHHHEHERLDALRRAAVAAELETGRREETVEEAERSIIRRVARITVGSLVLLAGLSMLALPGPGWVTIAAGLAILSRDVPFAARMLHKVRQRLPEDEDGNVNPWVIYGSVAMMVLALGGSIWWYVIR